MIVTDLVILTLTVLLRVNGRVVAIGLLDRVIVTDLVILTLTVLLRVNG